jgi:hypothetical protein
VAALTIQARPAPRVGDTGVFFAHTLTEGSAPDIGN